MIPVRLELKNFMSYGLNVMPLDFTGIHLACLSGDNGNGKSALLDAMTWALWGEARASADDLIRLGADEMRVTFDFNLDGNIYRVIRGRGKRNAANIWEIQLQDTDGSFKPITGQGIRDTARAVERILRMDYKTFINSAYIQQGRADEFTRQTVADRKKILADILDLSRYDDLEQRAKEKRNESEQTIQDIERRIGNAEIELANEENYKTQFTESKSERKALEAEIAAEETRFRDLQSKQAELDAAFRRVKEIKAQIDAWTSEITSLLAQQSDQEFRVQQSRKMIDDKPRITEGAAKLAAARKSAADLDKQLENLRSLEHRKSGLEQQIETEKRKLELEKNSLTAETDDIEKRISSSTRLETSLDELKSKVENLDKLETRKAVLNNLRATESDRHGALKAEYERALDTKQDLTEKLAMLKHPGAVCPLCRTELGEDKHDRLITDYERQITEIDRKIEELKKTGADAKKKRDSAQQEIAGIEESLKAGLETRKNLAQAEQSLSQMKDLRDRIPAIRMQITRIDKALSSGEFAAVAREESSKIAFKIASLKYDPAAHEKARSDIAELANFETLSIRLKHAEETLAADKATLKTTSDLIAARRKSISEQEKTAAKLAKSLTGVESVAAEMAEINSSLQEKRNDDREVTGRIATLEHSIELCKKLREVVKMDKGALEQARKDKAAYTELVTAFGKKGVQALIIENAIPEIQEEANRLLARMTDNAMQIVIETVRDKKTGGAAETLDIRVSDDMGTRSYDLFSGGEAFRVNFALRIALSKLLAHRAGARLQTLIIDEGFGTQDTKGREKLIESINSIAEDFEKILVITHIDELKDAFPTRIEISKDRHGSQISVE